MVRNWYARFPHITENADNLITNAEEAVEALKTGKIGINVKPREKGRNNVYQQLPSLLDVTCCVRLHNLLRVVGSFCAKFETSQTFEPTTPNISLFRDRRSVALQCCIGLHNSSNIVGAMHAHYTWFTTSYGL